MSKRAQIEAWYTKTEKLNATTTLAVGDTVQDWTGEYGVVVDIEKPRDPDNTDYEQGTVTVWQTHRTGYGGDNCEHYHYTSHKKHLRIVAHPFDCNTDTRNGKTINIGSHVGLAKGKRGIVVRIIRDDTHPTKGIVKVWHDKPFQSSNDNCVDVPYDRWDLHIVLLAS